MSRLTEPTRDNGGKNAWRHLTADELRTVAAYAVTNSQTATARHFGICGGTVRRACVLAGVMPAPHKFLNLADVAKAAELKPRAEVAEQFGIAEATVTRAKRIHGRPAA